MRLAILAAAFLLAAGPAAARDCRTPDAPPGVRVPPPAGCEGSSRSDRKPDQPSVRSGRSPGAIVLDDGTEIRIGGRVRVDALGQR
ncbi:MAG TPA: hypothetical protein VHL98_22775 [Microvirga sp.]|jgi:hypothetical protein|nr:hypothetical protein [Microvirga sp.]